MTSGKHNSPKPNAIIPKAAKALEKEIAGTITPTMDDIEYIEGLLKEKPLGKPGRPKAKIDWELFESLCGIQCTSEEMAGFLKVARSTLELRVTQKYNDSFSSVYKSLSEGGKCSLRRSQWKMSQKNASMGIWLGKQYLGQKDAEKTDNAEKVSSAASNLLNAVEILTGNNDGKPQPEAD